MAPDVVPTAPVVDFVVPAVFVAGVVGILIGSSIVDSSSPVLKLAYIP